MNWNNYFYVPFLKTLDAEFKAIQELTPEVKAKILPFVILTKGRASSKASLEKNPDKINGDINKNLQKWKDAFDELCPFFLDLSSEEVRQNDQIKDLIAPDGGYHNWVQFVIEKKKEFPEIIPLVQINDELDTSGGNNRKLQLEALLKNFDYVGYREEIFSSEDNADDFAGYIRETLDGILLENRKAPEKLILILDVGYLFPKKYIQAKNKVIEILNAINDLAIQHIIVTGTSFPLTISDFVEDQKVDEYEGSLDSEAILMYQSIKNEYHGTIMPMYGDYALIHPVKNKAMSYARGWIPRIDVSYGDTMHFIRRRRNKDDYKEAYQNIAYNISSKEWFSKVPECWGKEKIKDAAWGKIEKVIPQFWVSVRAKTHMSAIVAQCNCARFFED